MRFQDPTSLSWHFLTMDIKQTSLDDFKTAAVHKMSSSFLKGLFGWFGQFGFVWLVDLARVAGPGVAGAVLQTPP